MPATITDVATLAGVSPATVTRVLQGSPRVSPDTLERVKAAMAELDYRPSSVARSLRQQRTGTLGLIVTDVNNPFYPEIVRGAEDTARELGDSIILCNAAEDPEREIAYLDLLLERRVDGIIVAAGGLTKRHEDLLAAFPAPLVLINASLGRGLVPAILSDDEAGGRAAAQHLIGLGHRQLVHICGPASGSTSERLAGVSAAVAAAPGEVTLEVLEGDGYSAGGAAARQVAARLRPPYAITAHNDLIAVGVMHALFDLGIRVSQDVSVVGFDDIALAAYVNPGLTTIAQDKFGMGRLAVEIISRLRAGEAIRGNYVLPVRLVVRGSTGPAAGAGARQTAALARRR